MARGIRVHGSPGDGKRILFGLANCLVIVKRNRCRTSHPRLDDSRVNAVVNNPLFIGF